MLNKRPLHNRFVVTRVVFPPPKLLETSSQHALLVIGKTFTTPPQKPFSVCHNPIMTFFTFQATCRNRAEGRSFACSLCSKSFPTKRHLHDHNKRKHPQEVIVNSPSSSQSTSSQPSPSATQPLPPPIVLVRKHYQFRHQRRLLDNQRNCSMP